MMMWLLLFKCPTADGRTDLPANLIIFNEKVTSIYGQETTPQAFLLKYRKKWVKPNQKRPAFNKNCFSLSHYTLGPYNL